MGLTVWQEFCIAAMHAFRTLVPEPQDRIPISWRTAPFTFMQMIPFIFMAYLARRPNTRVMRVLMLPTLITTALHSAFGYVWQDPRLNVYNWGESLCAFIIIAKGIDMAFAPYGILKQGESASAVGSMEEPAVSAKKDADAPGDEQSQKRPGSSFIPAWLEDALEIMFAIRGIGWDFGRGVYIPKETRSPDRPNFLRETLMSFIAHYLLLDFFESLLKLVPGVGHPLGGSIFFSSLPPLQRYTLSTAIHFVTGCSLLAGFHMVYDLCTAVAVGLLGHSPSAWPPVVENPWGAQSLHEFWAKRWHQLLRQTFLVFGGIPGYVLFGNTGLVLGTFLASGLFHECTVYAMGRGWEWRVPVFFMMQGFSVIGERIWRMVTGRRVGGFFGRVWVYFDIVILAQPLVDSWHRRGLAGGMVIPPPLSPMRQIILPLVLPTVRRLTGLPI
ncbi:hypothetical protein EVG20_g6107 [Dentipellis fragilis]|uniref:Wax synthase domain-containing protein n=1 Tax=Dentipellis fragilis TaxID=205917 RepID=A0A4Y9YP82_9AGAM|nr:hypothetical protein EVG20_g6107 [Dentipellis fragilis]